MFVSLFRIYLRKWDNKILFPSRLKLLKKSGVAADVSAYRELLRKAAHWAHRLVLGAGLSPPKSAMFPIAVCLQHCTDFPFHYFIPPPAIFKLFSANMLQLPHDQCFFFCFCACMYTCIHVSVYTYKYKMWHISLYLLICIYACAVSAC